MIYLRTPEEIDCIRRSARMVSACLDVLEPLVVPGVTPTELDRVAEEFVRDSGAEPAFKGYRGFPATLCVSVNDVVVHGIPRDEELREGDIVGLDMGVVLDGYYGDSARTLAVGEVPEDVARLLRVTREALHKGIEQAVQGKRVGDIGHAIQAHAEGFGLSVVRELVGHGVGRQLHEEPQVPNYGTPGRGTKLSVGMVLAIEPMICLGSAEVYTMPDNWTVRTRDRSLSAHFEHTVAVGLQEAEILSLSEPADGIADRRAAGA
jgi:methionyl aminopeptidase